MSETIRKEACDVCGSRDNKVTWKNDAGVIITQCKTPGCTYNLSKNKNSESNLSMDEAAIVPRSHLMLEGEIRAIPTRGLTQETCKFWDYRIDEDIHGKEIHIANYYSIEERIRVAQKIRTSNKHFYFMGNTDNLTLYGQWLWQPNKNLYVTVIEGEVDALTLSQAQQHQYPVVSVARGAGSAYKEIAANLQWLLGFKHVVLCLDNAPDGIKETLKCLTLFEPQQVKIAKLPLKDANAMLLAGRQEELVRCIRYATTYKPDNVISIADIMPEILIQPEWGRRLPWTAVDNALYGLRLHEIHIVVSANGIGKTEYVTKCINHLLSSVNIALFSFEFTPSAVVQRLIATTLKNKCYLPGENWDVDAIRMAADALDQKLWLYKSCGGIEIDDLFNSMRYLVLAKDVHFIVIDNLKGLGLSHDKERADNFMRKLQAFVKELPVTVMLLSHVAKDKISKSAYVSTSPKNVPLLVTQTIEDMEKLLNKPGMEWESGRMPTKENVEGMSAVTDLADVVIGLARNTTSDDVIESRTLRVKILKSRIDSKYTGQVYKLYYTDTGEYVEIDYTESKRK